MPKGNLLSTQPYKGARDFFPEDMQVRNYIFDTWRMVCEKYGYDEYDFPIIEPFEIFAAKSGQELVNDQLFSFHDKAGRRLAVRPELTPGTVRMIASRYFELPKPIRWFMIGNNWRFERPQRGRGREFYQLEVNVFGEEDVIADFEIFSIIIDIMSAFGATEDMFEILVSDRRLLTALLQESLSFSEDEAAKIRGIMDRKAKLSESEFNQMLSAAGVDDKQSQQITAFMGSDFDTLSTVLPESILNKNEGYQAIKKLFVLLKENKIESYCRFEPAIIRGFDYSDGLVYEVFDKNPQNNRSMFGGERFDKLINIFGDFDLPATGFAMGDVTLKNFLESWNLLPELPNHTQVYVTLWNKESQYMAKTSEVARLLRERGLLVEMSLGGKSNVSKQIAYANKRNIPWVIIIGESELEKNILTIKNLNTGEQREIEHVEEAVKMVQSI